jgi:hypothetical protein
MSINFVEPSADSMRKALEAGGNLINQTLNGYIEPDLQKYREMMERAAELISKDLNLTQDKPLTPNFEALDKNYDQGPAEASKASTSKKVVGPNTARLLGENYEVQDIGK